MWTEEQVNILQSMLTEEKTAGKIARALNVSRNAVLGKIHRHPELRELAARRYTRKSTPPKPRISPKAWLKKPVGNTDFKTLPESRDDLVTVGVPLLRLSRGMCWWAVNEADKGELHLFCGAPTLEGARYCPHHAAMRNKPLPVRKRP